MKRFFWLGLIALLLFEIANVYFIMPMPGSQQMRSIDLAYFLYEWRWAFRIVFGIMIVAGLIRASFKRKWLPVLMMVITAFIVYMTNFKMAADHMFYQPKKLLMVDANSNKVDAERLVIGVNHNGQSRAYPIQFIGYHHQVKDTVGGKPVIVTYCTVCRTGRVFEPLVKGRHEEFRLVGMDHFNAMFEDKGTRSWWRQVSGEAITGKLKGEQLPEVFSTQTSLAAWLQMNPQSLIMQADPAYIDKYDSTLKFESGKSKKKLTGTDSLSWKNKSWVIGIKSGDARKAYDWNELMKKRVITDTIHQTPVLLVLGADNKSFFAFDRKQWQDFVLQHDTLIYQGLRFTLSGRGIDTNYSLTPIPAYQEFWHSWRTFNPNTTRY